MTDLIGVAERKKQCGVCKQQCGEEQIEHMRKRQRKYQETASMSPQEKQERIRQKSELARHIARAATRAATRWRVLCAACNPMCRAVQPSSLCVVLCRRATCAGRRR